MTPLLGWIPPLERTPRQERAHELAKASLGVRFSLPPLRLAPGESIRLFSAWKHPDVVADVGFEFNRIHQQTGSCLKGDAPVRMANGSEVPIASVAVGDRVVTHTGFARKVTSTFRRAFTGDMITLHIGSFAFPLTVTADHQVAVMRSDASWRWQPDRLEWVRADEVEEGDRILIGWDRRPSRPAALDTAELLGDRAIILDELMKDGAYTKGQEPDVPVANVCMARHIVKRSGLDWRGRVKLVKGRTENAVLRHIPVSPTLGRLIGLYLAEGGCHAGRVVFTFHAKETAFAGEVLAMVRGLFGVEGYLDSTPVKPNTLTVRFDNQTLASIFKALVPGDVYAKRIPGVFFGADAETKLALLLGWLHSDGHMKFDGDSLNIQGCSVSRGLARDMTVLALSCGIKASCHLRRARGKSRECCVVHLSGEKVRVLFPALAKEAAASGVRARKTDSNRCKFGYARPVKRIEREAVVNLPVFDIEVEEDHSFLSGDITVHNCVWAGGTNALFSTIAAQRIVAVNPTKAFLPFTLHNYAMSRHYMGDDGRGEGSLGTTFWKSLSTDGVRDWPKPAPAGLPDWQQEDGVTVTAAQEMDWSTSHNRSIPSVIEVARPHLIAATGECKSIEDIRAMLGSGFGVSFACNNYIGNGSIVGSGANAYVRGHWDGRGGHQQSLHAVWEHPSDGPVYWAQNNWPGSTYPRDPAGGPICGVWVLEKDVEAAMKLDAEIYGLSHLPWFPAPTKTVSNYI